MRRSISSSFRLRFLSSSRSRSSWSPPSSPPAATVGEVDATTSGGTGLPQPDCTGPLGAPRDPATLPSCCTDSVGGAHCLPDDVIPSELRGFLAACPTGGSCVPDPFIETGGVYTPASCTSLEGAPGVCLSACIPQVADYIKLLPQDVCADDERCAPCTNPLDNTDTGACQILVLVRRRPERRPGGGGGGGGPGPATCPHHGPPVIDPDHAAGVRARRPLPGRPLVPPAMADQLAACHGGGSKCVPDEFIAAGGNYIPPTCQSVAGAEGRCLSTALPQVAAQAQLLPQSTCAADHLCAPCYDPLTGDDTGACRLSCDPGPAAGPSKLPTCCSGRGTCVPAAAAGDKVGQLGQDSCPDPTDGGDAPVCAPDVFLHAGLPPAGLRHRLARRPVRRRLRRGPVPARLPAGGVELPDRPGQLRRRRRQVRAVHDPLTGQPTGACDL